MMLTKLSVRNYQSIAEADLTLAPVTLICGRNFSGKSALLRALSALCYGQTGEEFIQHGEKEAQVSLWTEDRSITWTKPRGKSADYYIEGGEQVAFTKTGSSVPAAITDLLAIREIEVDSTLTLRPQIQTQFDGPFLIGESGSKIARVLGKLTRLDLIVTAQMNCRKERDRTKRDGDTARQEQERLEAQLEAMPDVTAIREDYTLVTAAIEKAQSILAQVEQAKAAQARLTTARKLVDVDTGAAALAVEQAKAMLPDIEQARSLGARLALERNHLVHAQEGVERNQKAVADIRQRYEAICEKAGICEVCPWR